MRKGFVQSSGLRERGHWNSVASFFPAFPAFFLFRFFGFSGFLPFHYQKKRKNGDSSGSFARGGADGVGVKFPIFAVNCCCLPLSFRRSRESEEKGEKCVEKGENA